MSGASAAEAPYHDLNMLGLLSRLIQLAAPKF